MVPVHNLLHDISVQCQQSMKLIMEETTHHPAGRIFIHSVNTHRTQAMLCELGTCPCPCELAS